MFSIFYQLGHYGLTFGGWQPGLQAKQADEERELVGVFGVIFLLSGVLLLGHQKNYPKV